MSNSLSALLSQLKNSPETVDFNQVMETIAEHYDYSPAAFTNGEAEFMADNAAGTNEGSCKIFAFAQLHNLGTTETLALFGDFYRSDVLQHPTATDHTNIRNFMRSGWAGIAFANTALVLK